jgi:hypothetical protein
MTTLTSAADLLEAAGSIKPLLDEKAEGPGWIGLTCI